MSDHDRVPVGPTPSPANVVAAAAYVCSTLSAAADRPEHWDVPAGSLTLTCRQAAAHVGDCCNWYAALLARCSPGPVEVAEVDRSASPAVLLDSIVSGAAVLAAAVASAGPDDRAWHSFGIADRAGFAAMGMDEILVHGADIASGLDLAYSPPPALCLPVVRRLFPWAPPVGDAEAWPALLWANGRAPLGDAAPPERWTWHCAPLDEWDGTDPGTY